MENVDLAAFGARLKKLRSDAGYSQQELAALTKKSMPAIQKWEKGDFLPRDANLSRLARALNCTVEHLKFGVPYVPVLPAESVGPMAIHPTPAMHTPREELYIPLLGKIAATPFRLAHAESATKFMVATRSDIGCFALEIEGESMSPEYEHGDIIFVRPARVELTPYNPDDGEGMPFVPYEQVAPFHGKDCVVLYNGDSSFKRLDIQRGKGPAYSVDILSVNEDKKRYPTIHVRRGHEFFVQGVCYKSQKER
jgi:transcriptional regulator with XRE-family HTH domain